MGAIVRASEERTWRTTRSLLEENDIEVLSCVSSSVNSSFSAKLLASYMAGLGTAWDSILHVDGDVLPFRDIGSIVQTLIRQMDSDVLCAQPKVFDKAFFAWRHAGVHLYDRKLLSEALQASPSIPLSSRPETAFLNAANRKLGLRTHLSDLHFGLHDFEQSFEHLYHKSFAKVSKMRRWTPYLLSLWSNFAHDKDFRVMRAGLISGLLNYAVTKARRKSVADYQWGSAWPGHLNKRFPGKPPLSEPLVLESALSILDTELRTLGRSDWARRSMPDEPKLRHAFELLFLN